MHWHRPYLFIVFLIASLASPILRAQTEPPVYKKRYVISHIDNLGTAISSGEGKLDLSKQVMTTFGKMDDPTMDERDKPVKYVTRVVSKDKYVFEIYDEVGSPNEFKMLEITYTRSKP